MKINLLQKLSNLSHNTINLINKHRATSLLLWLYFGLTVLKLRQYSFYNPNGYIDPWVNVGYAQVFPNTAFQYSYYKESRIISILWEKLVLINEPFVMICTISLTGLFCLWTIQQQKKMLIINILFVSFLVISPYYWGDYAGGGDYYDTLGNLFVAISIFLWFNFLSGTKDKLYYRLVFGVVLGFLLLELPSGFLVVLIYFLAQLLLSLKDNYQLSISGLQKLTFTWVSNFLGILFYALIQVTILIIFHQKASRILSGPKFLFYSLTHASTITPSWTSINISNLKEFPCVSIFLLNSTALIVLTLFIYKRKIAFSQYELVISYEIFSLALIILQFMRSSIYLNISYFLVPLILFSSVLLLATLNALNFSNSKFIFGFFAILLITYVIRLKLWIVILGVIAILILFSKKRRVIWIELSIALLFLSMLWVNGTHFDNSEIESAQLKLCDQVRHQQKSDLLHVSEILDEKAKRGTIIMGLSDDVFAVDLTSKCAEFNGAPVYYQFIALSAMGFPGANWLGPIKSHLLQKKLDSYSYSEFGQPLNRTNKPHSCVAIFSTIPQSKTELIKILGEKYYLRLSC